MEKKTERTVSLVDTITRLAIQHREKNPKSSYFIPVRLVNVNNIHITKICISPKPDESNHWTVRFSLPDHPHMVVSEAYEEFEIAWNDAMRKFERINCCCHCKTIGKENHDLYPCDYGFQCLACWIQGDFYAHDESKDERCCGICKMHLFRFNIVETNCKHQFHDHCLGIMYPNPLCPCVASSLAWDKNNLPLKKTCPQLRLA